MSIRSMFSLTVDSSDFDERNYHRRLERRVERQIAKQPRFGVVRCSDGSPHAVWDHQTGVWHPVGEILAGLFAAVGLA